MNQSCASCTHSYQTPQLTLKCSHFGCECTDKTAIDCTEFRREPGSDDEQPWYRGAWCVTSSTEGRGG